MQYCLEMDLLCSSKAREEYYKILEVPKSNQNTNYLLINMKKRIKKIEVFMKVLNSLSNKDLPESYKKIRNFIIEDLNKKYNLMIYFCRKLFFELTREGRYAVFYC